MCDTVGLSFEVALSQSQFQYWIREKETDYGNGYVEIEFKLQKSMDNGAPIKSRYYPPNQKYPKPRFSLEVSLPHLLFGNNVYMITEDAQIEEATQLITKYLDSQPWAPKVDANQGKLYRVDVAYNHFVGDLVQDYIPVLFRLPYPQRRTKPFSREGVQYYSKFVTTKFYSKSLICKHHLAQGVLRQETTLRRNFYIERKMGLFQPTLKDLTVNWAIQTLIKDLEKLHLNDCQVCSRDLAREILRQNYSCNKADKLYGYFMTRQDKNPKQMEALGYSKRVIQNNNKMLTNAGVSLAMIDNKIQLPPLNINMNQYKIGYTVVSDT
jgi:hypothetical protein